MSRKGLGAVVGAIWSVAAIFMVTTAQIHGYKADLWIPSLTCNLFTTGLAIVIVNGLIARSERRRLEAAEKTFKERQLEQVSRLMQQTASGLGLVHVMGVLEDLERSRGVDYVDKWSNEVREQGRDVLRRAQLYAHMLDADTLSQLDIIGSCLEQLAGIGWLRSKPFDYQAGIIFQALEGILDGHRHLVNTFDLPSLREFIDDLQPKATRLSDKLKVGNKHWQEWCKRNGVASSQSPPTHP